MWYTREEAGLRFAFFSNTTALAVAFGGLLASAIGIMDGLRGYRGWRWIFIIEGCLTCVIAGVLYFSISSFPEQVDWLSEDEKNLLLENLRREQGSSAIEEPFSWKAVGGVLTDPQVLLGGFMFMGLIVPGYGTFGIKRQLISHRPKSLLFTNDRPHRICIFRANHNQDPWVWANPNPASLDSPCSLRFSVLSSSRILLR